MGERLKGKVAVVTGAARGIGRGCAEMMAREGARVVLSDKDDAAGQHATKVINDFGADAIFQHCDVVDEDECAELMRVAVERYEKIDALVNNVGWFPRATLETTTTELWNDVMNVNLRGAFYCCKYAVPHMQKTGGSVINIGSPNGIQAIPTLVAYGAAKGGLLNLTRTLAGAYSTDKIRFNYLSPGWVLTETEIATQLREGKRLDDILQMGNSLRLGRHQTVDDTAHAVVFLASDESTQITGSIFSVDAGMTTLLPLP
jgi:NAD(P)-dependent dehydrogenase (short-subunit alcohol dehydrogenase family)